MLKWLFEILVGWPWCPHRWEIHETTNLHDHGVSSSMRVGVRYTLRCSRCGDLKARTFP